MMEAQHEMPETRGRVLLSFENVRHAENSETFCVLINWKSKDSELEVLG